MTANKKIALTAFNKAELADLGVSLLIAFGSRVVGEAREQSDYDIGVIFDASIPARARRYGALYSILQKKFSDVRIDLVDLSVAPFPMQFRAAMEGDVLYYSLRVAFADYRERAMRSYFDFIPILKIHEEALGI